MYYEAYPAAGGYKWKVYKYGPSGDREIIVHKSEEVYDTAGEAINACGEYMDDNDIDAELV